MFTEQSSEVIIMQNTNDVLKQYIKVLGNNNIYSNKKISPLFQEREQSQFDSRFITLVKSKRNILNLKSFNSDKSHKLEWRAKALRAIHNLFSKIVQMIITDVQHSKVEWNAYDFDQRTAAKVLKWKELIAACDIKLNQMLLDVPKVKSSAPSFKGIAAVSEQIDRYEYGVLRNIPSEIDYNEVSQTIRQFKDIRFKVQQVAKITHTLQKILVLNKTL
jgi:hypothetical protein